MRGSRFYVQSSLFTVIFFNSSDKWSNFHEVGPSPGNQCPFEWLFFHNGLYISQSSQRSLRKHYFFLIFYIKYSFKDYNISHEGYKEHRA